MWLAAQGSENFSEKKSNSRKIREDNSDFDDFWTELIARAWAIISNFLFVRQWGPIDKNFEKF